MNDASARANSNALRSASSNNNLGGSTDFFGMTRDQRQNYLSDQILKARDEMQVNSNPNAALTVCTIALSQINAVLATIPSGNNTTAAGAGKDPFDFSAPSPAGAVSSASSNTTSAAAANNVSPSNPAALEALGPAYVLQRLRLLLIAAEAQSRLKNHTRALEYVKEAIRKGGKHSAQAYFIGGRETYLLNMIEESVAMFSAAEALLESGVAEVEEVNTVSESWSAIGIDPSRAPSDLRPSEVKQQNGGLGGWGISLSELDVLSQIGDGIPSAGAGAGVGGKDEFGIPIASTSSNPAISSSNGHHPSVMEWAGELAGYRGFKQQADMLFQLTQTRCIPNGVQNANAVTRFVRRHMAATGNADVSPTTTASSSSSANSPNRNPQPSSSSSSAAQPSSSSSSTKHATGGLAILVKNYTDMPIFFTFGYVEAGTEWDSMLKPPSMIPANNMGAYIIRPKVANKNGPVGATVAYKLDEKTQIMFQAKAPSVTKISEVIGVGNTNLLNATPPSISSPSPAAGGVHVKNLMRTTDRVGDFLAASVLETSTAVANTPTLKPYWFKPRPSPSTTAAAATAPLQRPPATNSNSSSLSPSSSPLAAATTTPLGRTFSDSLSANLDASVDPAVKDLLALKQRTAVDKAANKVTGYHPHTSPNVVNNAIANCTSSKSSYVFGHMSYFTAEFSTDTAIDFSAIVGDGGNDKNTTNEGGAEKANQASNPPKKRAPTVTKVFQITAQRPHLATPNVLVFAIHEYRDPIARLSELDLTSVFEFLHPDHRYKAACINRSCRSLINALPPTESYYEARFVNEGTMIDTNLSPSDTVGPIHRSLYPSYAIHRDFFDSPFIVRDKGSVSFDFGVEKSPSNTAMQHLLAFDPTSDTLLFHYLVSAGTLTTERFLFYGPRRRSLMLQLSENNILGIFAKKSCTVYAAGGAYANPSGSNRMTIGRIEAGADNTLNFIATFENAELAQDPVLARLARASKVGSSSSASSGVYSPTSSSSSSSTSKCLYKVQRRYIPGTKQLEQIVVVRGPDFPVGLLPAHLQQSQSSATVNGNITGGGRYASSGAASGANRPNPNAFFAGGQSLLNTSETVSYELCRRPPSHRPPAASASVNSSSASPPAVIMNGSASASSSAPPTTGTILVGTTSHGSDAVGASAVASGTIVSGKPLETTAALPRPPAGGAMTTGQTPGVVIPTDTNIYQQQQQQQQTELHSFVARFTRPSGSAVYTKQQHTNSSHTTRLGELVVTEGSDALLAFLLLAYAYEQWS